MHRRCMKLLLGNLLLVLTLIGCGAEGTTPTPAIIVSTPTPAEAPQAEPTPVTEAQPSPRPWAEGQILQATFAHGLTEQMQPRDPGVEFASDETVHLAMRIRGQPEQGRVLARFFWRDSVLSEVEADLAQRDQGLIFAMGGDTYTAFTLTHDEPFPIGDKYRADLFYNEQFLGSYLFRVVPPPEAIPSRVKQVTLARGADADYNPLEPAVVFAGDEVVYLVGRGDLGQGTWLQADWFVNGQWDEAGTRSFAVEENAPDAGFAFSHLPEEGWPAGEHFVAVTMNDQEVGRYPFVVSPASGAAPSGEAPFWEAFPLPEDAEAVAVTEGYDVGFATALSEPELFEVYAGWLEAQGWKQQAPTEAMETLPHQVWRKEGAELLIEIQGLDEANRTVVWLQLTAGTP